MRIAKITAGGHEYYLGAVADGREDHRPPGAEPDGAWLGPAAGHLGLTGRVARVDLGLLLDGRRPEDGGGLNPHRSRVRVAGFDLTFAAPKSVSLLWGLAGEPVVGAVGDAHAAAVADALGYLDRVAARARRREEGAAVVVPARGLVTAGFLHHTSRASDPHLHSHVVVANLAEDEQGRWSALDARALYAHARTAGSLYQARLRHELVARLGVELGPVRHGVAQVAGLDRELLTHFSRRRAQVELQLGRWGTESPAAAEVAALHTRPVKDLSLPLPVLQETWRARAERLGCSWDVLAGVVGRAPPGRPPVLEELVPVLLGPDGLTAGTGRFGRRELVQRVAEALPQGATVGVVERLAAQLADSGRLATRPGRLVGGVPEPMWTTTDLARAEAALAAWAERRQQAGAGQVAPEIVAAALARRPALAPGQTAAVERLLRSGAGVEAVRAPSGPPVGDVLEAAGAAWEAGGHRVVAVAPTAGEASRLEAGTGILGSTPAGLEAAVGPGDGRGTVVVMVGAERLDTGRLGVAVGRFPAAKFVLVAEGGGRQGPGSGVMAAVAERIGVLTVERESGSRWAEVESADAPVELSLDGRCPVSLQTTAAGLRRAALERWWAGQGSDRSPVMVAPGAAETADLNAAARSRLRRAGQLGPVLHEGRRGVPELAQGDQVMVRWPPARSKLLPGVVARVTGGSGGRITLRTADGNEATLSLDAIRPGQLAHAYALGPVDVARGRVTARAVVLGGPEALPASTRPPEPVWFGALVGGGGSIRDGAASPDPLLALAREWGFDPASAVASVPATTLAELGEQREAVAARLLATLPPDPAPAWRALQEEREAARAGLERARDRGAPELVQRWEAALAGLAGREGELAAATAQRATWLADHGALLHQYAGLTEAADRRRRALGRAADVSPPARLEALLGPRPSAPAERERWREAAAAVEAFRERWGAGPEGVPDAGRPSLGRPSLGRPVPGRPALGRPSLGRPALVRPEPDRLAFLRDREAERVGRLVADTRRRLLVDRGLDRAGHREREQGLEVVR